MPEMTRKYRNPETWNKEDKWLLLAWCCWFGAAAGLLSAAFVALDYLGAISRLSRRYLQTTKNTRNGYGLSKILEITRYTKDNTKYKENPRVPGIPRMTSNTRNNKSAKNN